MCNIGARKLGLAYYNNLGNFFRRRGFENIPGIIFIHNEKLCVSYTS